MAYSIIQQDLAILEKAADTSARIDAVYHLIATIDPPVGKARLASKDFFNESIRKRLSFIISKEDNCAVQCVLADLIAKIRDPLYVPVLTQLFRRTQNVPAKLEIIDSRAKLGDTTVMPELINYLRTDDVRSVQAAILGLSQFNNETTTDLIIEGLLRPHSQTGLFDAVETLVQRNAQGAIPSLKKIIAGKNYGYGLSVINGLATLDTNYGKEILLECSDTFALKVLATGISIKRTVNLSIPKLQAMAMDQNEDIRIRRSALISLRLGYYDNINWVRRLDNKESEFFSFLKKTSRDQKENRLLSEECTKIISIKENE